MYGVLQITSGNENVGFLFLCQSTDKRRTVFSFPPVVGYHIRLLTMMCLSPACLISESPPPPTPIVCTPCKLPFTRAVLYQAFTFTLDFHAVLEILLYFSFSNAFLSSCCCVMLHDRNDCYFFVFLHLCRVVALV